MDRKNHYLGDSCLKAPEVSVDWTENDIEEYKKCYNDVVYFIENYMKIVHIDKGIVPFDMYHYQKQVIDLYTKSRFVTLKFPRQSGKCSDFSTCINIRNKYNGVSKKITIGEFYELQKNKRDNECM